MIISWTRVTWNDVSASAPPASSAVTVVSEVPLGTAKPHVKSPELFPCRDPVAQLTIGTPSNSNDLSEVETENPVPVTATVDPTGPWPGVVTIPGVVTMNVPVADWPLVSSAVTVVPDVLLGAANPHEKAPELSVVSVPVVHWEIDTESKTKEARAFETEKPVPETATAAPTGPSAGVTWIAGEVTVNVAEAETDPLDATIV